MKAQVTMENGERWSTDKVLHKICNHALTIHTHALATKVRIKNLLHFSLCAKKSISYNN